MITTAALDSFFDGFTPAVRKSILDKNQEGAYSGSIFSLQIFTAKLAKAYSELVRESTSGASLSQDERKRIYWAICDVPWVWKLDDSGALSLDETPGVDKDLAWANLIEPRHYPILAAMTIASEDMDEPRHRAERSPNHIRGPLELLADAALLRLLRAEYKLDELAESSHAAKLEMVTALWGHADLVALAAGHPAAVDAYLGLSEEVRFQAQLLMKHRELDTSVFDADPRIAALDPEFTTTLMGAAAVRDNVFYTSFEVFMEDAKARYAEHQAYVADPDAYLDVEDKTLALYRSLKTNREILVERLLVRFPEPSADSEFTAERYAWLHAEGVKTGVKPEDIKDVFNSVSKPYQTLLIAGAPTGEAMKLYNDVLIGHV